MMITRQMSFLKSLLYLIAQFSGAILASLTLRVVLPSAYITSLYGNLGCTVLSADMTVLGGLVIEFVRGGEKKRKKTP